MTTGDRMRARRKEIGVSAEEIASALGVSAATVYRYENGEIEKLPGNILDPLSKALRTTPAYLMGWEKTDVSGVKNIIPLPKTYQVPLVGTIACGKPILAVEEAEETVSVPEWIAADFALRCKGDSMITARIFDGDIVYIREQPAVENGQIAAVRIDEEATLKKVYYTPNSDRITLRACNPLYSDMVYAGEALNQIQVLGLAVGFYSKVRHEQ